MQRIEGVLESTDMIGFIDRLVDLRRATVKVTEAACSVQRLAMQRRVMPLCFYGVRITLTKFAMI